MTKIYLDASSIPAHLRASYTGKKFAATICTSVAIPADAGLWSGGTREHFSGINLVTGETKPFAGQDTSPFSRGSGESQIDLLPGFAIIRHSHFCGTDMGLEFFIHPDNAPAFLPAPTNQLTVMERLILLATRSLKSFYGGRDRYEMAKDEFSCRQIIGQENYPTRAEWETVKQQLVAKGLLTKAGAITNAGRNAAERLR